jgi:hypothetical protein
MTKREQALEFVLAEVAAGTEFPDATALAWSRFSVPSDQIRADYDAYCLRAFDEMENSGGGFASALANAWHRADSGNRAIIEKGWPHLIKRYGA